ncbi:sporulation protein [Streptomyces sp. NPDC087437]|uniref:sporulation protein n=1 Tax=Streptomyces sp. NPDC087437 TaxID=3365789 RepID=UPI0038263C50
MGFRRAFGFKDSEPLEIDTQISTLAPLPGHHVEGDMVIKGGSRGIAIGYINLRIMAKAALEDVDVLWMDASRSRFNVAPGTEERVPFSGRLPWACPVTELSGHTLGVDLALTTRFERGEESPVLHVDFLHVAAPPLYEAVLNTFAEEGYRGDIDSQVISEDLTDTESELWHYQTFFITDPSRGLDRLAELEVVFLQNAVGAMVHVRRAARSQLRWEDKPPTRSFPAAHHEVGQVDFGERVRKVLAELAAVSD